MKKIFFLAMALACAFATSFALSNIPAAVESAFNHQFPNATHVKWEKENAKEYEASFEWKGEKLSANFSVTGEWLETESTITFIQLPEKVKTAFNVAHKGAIIKEVAKIETSKGTTKFELEIKRGLKTVELFYTTDGTEIKE